MAPPSGSLTDGTIETVRGPGDEEIALHLALELAVIEAVEFSTEHYLPRAECQREQ